MKMVYFPFPAEPFLDPSEVVKSFGLKEGEKVLDCGAGSGFWSIPMARAVGRTGHVFVTDAKKENLSVIKRKAGKEGLENLSYYVAPYELTEMPIQTKVDVILCSNVLSIIGTDENIFKAAKKLAKKNSRFIIIEWKKDSEIGPKKEDKINEEEIITAAEKQGFEFKKLLSAGAHHTGLYFVYNK
ncbi:MAG: class I SAM-dependent methyltransferase [Patescibacteria group bacterium]|nr:class I SAM-dependent methyltransferase [Patescibacteria group bacterium]